MPLDGFEEVPNCPGGGEATVRSSSSASWAPRIAPADVPRISSAERSLTPWATSFDMRPDPRPDRPALRRPRRERASLQSIHAS